MLVFPGAGPHARGCYGPAQRSLILSSRPMHTQVKHSLIKSNERLQKVAPRGGPHASDRESADSLSTGLDDHR